MIVNCVDVECRIIKSERKMYMGFERSYNNLANTEVGDNQMFDLFFFLNV